MSPNTTDHLPKLRSLLSESFNVQKQDINAGTKLSDLGMDSLDCVELMMGLEEEFGVDISEEDEQKFMQEDATVQTLLDYLGENAQ